MDDPAAIFWYPRAETGVTPEEFAAWAQRLPRLSPAEARSRSRAVKRAFEAKGRRGARPLTLHVGPNTLSPEEVQAYRLMASLVEHGAPPLLAVFLEPQGAVLEALRGHLLDGGLQERQVRVVHAAVCPGNESHMPFYGLSRGLLQRLPQARAMLDHARGAFSLEREKLLNDLRVNRLLWGTLLGHVFSEEEWDMVVASLEETQVRCLSPGAILAEAAGGPAAEERFEPRDVDVLTVDAEGSDPELVALFLQLEGFAPASLVFEWGKAHGGRPAKLQGLVSAVKELAARGYNVHKSEHDVVAILADLDRRYGDVYVNGGGGSNATTTGVVPPPAPAPV